MTYAKRLLLSKLCISASLVTAFISSLTAVQPFRASNIKALMHAEQVYVTVLIAVLISALLLPLLYLIWGRLHGTGRGVRMAAIISIIAIASPLLAAHFTAALPGLSDVHIAGLIFQSTPMTIGVLCVLFLGVLLSINPSKC